MASARYVASLCLGASYVFPARPALKFLLSYATTLCWKYPIRSNSTPSRISLPPLLFLHHSPAAQKLSYIIFGYHHPIPTPNSSPFSNDQPSLYPNHLHNHLNPLTSPLALSPSTTSTPPPPSPYSPPHPHRHNHTHPSPSTSSPSYPPFFAKNYHSIDSCP